MLSFFLMAFAQKSIEPYVGLNGSMNIYPSKYKSEKSQKDGKSISAFSSFPSSFNPSLGIHGGFLYYFSKNSPFFGGLEGDMRYTFLGGTQSVRYSMDQNENFRIQEGSSCGLYLKLGAKVRNFYIYGKAGPNFTNFSFNASGYQVDSPFDKNDRINLLGMKMGFGLENKFTDCLSVGSEISYKHLPKMEKSIDVGKDKVNNYEFNPGSLEITLRISYFF